MSFKLKKKDFIDNIPKRKKRKSLKKKSPSLPENISSPESISQLHEIPDPEKKYEIDFKTQEYILAKNQIDEDQDFELNVKQRKETLLIIYFSNKKDYLKIKKYLSNERFINKVFQKPYKYKFRFKPSIYIIKVYLESRQSFDYAVYLINMEKYGFKNDEVKTYLMERHFYPNGNKGQRGTNIDVFREIIADNYQKSERHYLENYKSTREKREQLFQLAREKKISPLLFKWILNWEELVYPQNENVPILKGGKHYKSHKVYKRNNYSHMNKNKKRNIHMKTKKKMAYNKKKEAYDRFVYDVEHLGETPYYPKLI